MTPKAFLILKAKVFWNSHRSDARCGPCFLSRELDLLLLSTDTSPLEETMTNYSSFLLGRAPQLLCNLGLRSRTIHGREDLSQLLSKSKPVFYQRVSENITKGQAISSRCLRENYSRRVSPEKRYQAPPWQHMVKNPEVLGTWHLGWIWEAATITIC